VLAAGADCLIAGTAVFGAADYATAIVNLRQAAPAPAIIRSVSTG
jgi:ribulose-phosphate 3-epimerase